MGAVGAAVKWTVGSVLVLGALGAAGALLIAPKIKAQMELTRGGGPGLSVRAEPVSSGVLIRTVSAPGYLEPVRKVSISARISAQITDLPFDLGDAVNAGDTVVRLDNADLMAQLASAEASLMAEQARLDGARATYLNTIAEWERRQTLFGSNDVAKSALEQAEAEKLRAESNLRASQASIEVARAQIQRIREDLRYTEIPSPITGVVTKLNAEVGEIVITGTMNNAGTVILEIADLSEMIVRVECDETDIADVRVGQTARVYLTAYPDETFTGVVRRIALQRSKARNQSDVFEVEVLLKDQGRTLFSGLNASVDIEVETLQDVLLAPSQAVLDKRIDELPESVTLDNPTIDAQKTFARIIFEIRDGKAHAVPVRVGPSDLQTTAILAGATPGAQIITGPYKALAGLKHGDAVRTETPKPASTDAPAGEQAATDASEERAQR
ncbi:MAG: efflux RND transporter periplasmic adaptor subunit [Phycisphaeraceae bacterium]|nr:efflux RND transporter periplasmic adaptor subunit [Phycisphaeraceae bacterium]